MVSLKNKQSGFTLVELLIVIVVIGILAALVITTFAGVQQRARNTERQTDINAIATQLEGYYAKNGSYPTLANVNDATWRSTNEFKLDVEALKDPSAAATTLSATEPTVLATQPNQAYFYEQTGSGSGFRLAARYEGQVNGQDIYRKNSQ